MTISSLSLRLSLVGSFSLVFVASKKISWRYAPARVDGQSCKTCARCVVNRQLQQCGFKAAKTCVQVAWEIDYFTSSAVRSMKKHLPCSLFLRLLLLAMSTDLLCDLGVSIGVGYCRSCLLSEVLCCSFLRHSWKTVVQLHMSSTRRFPRPRRIEYFVAGYRTPRAEVAGRTRVWLQKPHPRHPFRCTNWFPPSP